MSEENKTIELKEEDISKVSGGNNLIDTVKTQYCKYCQCNTEQVYTRSGLGWDSNGDSHTCDIWSCQVCNNENYRRSIDNVLI